jgi:hypothetical protein
MNEDDFIKEIINDVKMPYYFRLLDIMPIDKNAGDENIQFNEAINGVTYYSLFYKNTDRVL